MTIEWWGESFQLSRQNQQLFIVLFSKPIESRCQSFSTFQAWSRMHCRRKRCWNEFLDQLFIYFWVLWFLLQYPNLSIPASKTQSPSLIFRHLIPTKSRRLTVMFIISGLFREEKIAYFYMVLISMKNQVKEHWSFGSHLWKTMPA